MLFPNAAYLNAEGQEEAVVFYAADTCRQLEPSCQGLWPDALVDLGHVQRQLNRALPLVRRCANSICQMSCHPAWHWMLCVTQNSWEALLSKLVARRWALWSSNKGLTQQI